MNRRAFIRGDYVCGLIACLVSFGIYLYTLAPNVTLLDSGEFMTAALHFGVPHPTGYPLWTLLVWLFHLVVPFGSGAWKVNLFSAVCGGLAVGLTAALTRSGIRWLFGKQLEIAPRLADITSLSVSLLFALSFAMWSQAVIAEVYTLHALLVGLFLTSIYIWLHSPHRLGWLLMSFFLLALSFSNHHLTLFMAAVPFVAVLLARSKIFFDLIFASLLTVLLVYLEFAILSQDLLLIKTAIRFFYVMALAFGIFLWVRRMKVSWLLVAFVPVVVVLGLLPYAYMPFASSTNPPMNWGYTRDPSGFYFSFNRSQYPGSLSEQSLKTLGRLMGTKPQSAEAEAAPPNNPLGIRAKSFSERAQDWLGFFWLQLARSFTLLAVLGYFAAFLVIFRVNQVARRTWIYVLEVAFLLAAFAEPFLGSADIDMGSWWVEMPYHAYTNLIFALIAGLGLAYLFIRLIERLPRMRVLQYAMLALPIVPFLVNEKECSQRGRWFGWEYGYDMLKDLPKGSVVFGGTDPGRFVPTYMIFGESFEDPKYKRDPSFDRRDLYILTQNAIGESFYMRYLRDQYGPDRPKVKNSFERWLGRETVYPEKPLIFPKEKDEEIKDAIEKEIARIKAESGEDVDIYNNPNLFFGTAAKWIWEKNKDTHDFFVEESFPMKWSYDYALPHGLVYQINKTKLDAIPPDVVQKDMVFWRNYTDKLLSNPLYQTDFDAQRSFSKLRQTTGNIYKYRKMTREAEEAHREAVLLWPGNLDAIMALSGYLWERGDFDGVIALFNQALVGDPNNIDLWRLLGLSQRRKEKEAEIQSLVTLLKDNPKSRDITKQLIELYSKVGETNKSDPLMNQALKDFSNDADFLRYAIDYYEANNQRKLSLEPAKQLVLLETNNARNFYVLSRAYFSQNNTNEFYKAAGRAIELGGLPVREYYLSDPIFQSWRNDEAYKKLTKPEVLPGKK